MEAIFVTSSLASTISSEKADLDTLSPRTVNYFRARFRNRMYDLVLSKFREKAESESLTKARIAKRLRRRPEVVNRLLAAPGNWTLDTLSDLLLAIAGEELDKSSSDPEKRPSRNARSRDLESPKIDDSAPSKTDAMTEYGRVGLVDAIH
jgi:hypothetical protein